MNSKYTESDLQNIIALCSQDEEKAHAASLRKRCERALAYRDVSIHMTRQDKAFLRSLYDPDMDPDAKATLEKIL